MAFKEMVRAALPRWYSRHRIVGGRLRGKYIVTSWHDYPAAIVGYAEKPLLEWLWDHVKPSETWIDVGASHGYTSLALCQCVGEAGRVFAFEPMYTSLGCLNQTRRSNDLAQLVILPFGLSDVDDLSVGRFPTLRGMICGGGSQLDSDLLENIMLASFDYLWPKIAGGDLQIHGVKIDVQGMEIAVIEGMKASLERWRPVLVVEIHEGVDQTQFADVLRDCGYSIKGDPVKRDGNGTHSGFESNESYAFFPL